MNHGPEPLLAAHVDRLPRALPPGVAEEVRTLSADATRVDRVAPLSEQPLMRLVGNNADVVHLMARDPGDLALVGYAQVDLGSAVATAELVVAPQARRRHVGTVLLDAVRWEARPPTIPDKDGPGGSPGVRVWAHGDLPAARCLAAAAGMPVVRELWQMRLELGPGPTADVGPRRRRLPAGVTVRPFVPGQDEDAWRRVNARAFSSHPEQGRITRADLRAREREPWFDPAGFLMAERDGVLLASIWTKVHPAGAHGDERVGEIYALGVDPDAQGLGLGGALTSLGLEHLRGLGLRSVILYTEAENTVAIRTYARAGFIRSAVDVMFGSGTPG